MHRDSFGGRPSGRPVIGLLVDWLEDNYQNTVVSGVADAARELDVDLICFTGGVLRSPYRFAAQRNAIYDLAGPENVDGLLIMSGTLGNAVGPDELARWCERYRPLPMCSIAVPLPGIPSVLVDNATGMRELVVHLVEAHGYRRIAFIRGPEANDESERRYRVYRDVLAEHDLQLDPRLVVAGGFQRATSAEAIGRLWDEHGMPIDAVVAASDSMALGAMDALRARGLRVPEDVAVAGFDDVDEARFATPPLTTVRQPLYEQGRRAVETVLAMLQGRPVPEQVTLHTELVPRQSCRCARRGAPRGPASERWLPGAGFESVFAAHRDRALAAMGLAARGPAHVLDEGWGARILDAFTTDLLSVTTGALAVTFERIVRRVIDAGGDAAAWQDVLSVLRREALPAMGEDPHLRARAEDLLHEIPAARRRRRGERAGAAPARRGALGARPLGHRRGAGDDLRRGLAGARRGRPAAATAHPELLHVALRARRAHRRVVAPGARPRRRAAHRRGACRARVPLATARAARHAPRAARHVRGAAALLQGGSAGLRALRDGAPRGDDLRGPPRADQRRAEGGAPGPAGGGQGQRAAAPARRPREARAAARGGQPRHPGEPREAAHLRRSSPRSAASRRVSCTR